MSNVTNIRIKHTLAHTQCEGRLEHEEGRMEDEEEVGNLRSDLSGY